MSYHVAFNPELQIVEVLLVGEIDDRCDREKAILATKLGREHDCRRFLVDWTRATFSDTTANIYGYVADLKKLGHERSDRLAVVIGQDEEAHTFFQTAAHHQGWFFIRHFDNRPAALEWLVTE